MKRAFAVVATIATLVFCISRASAEVRDDGNFFSPQAIEHANDAIRQMQQSTGRDLLIETYPAIPQERASSYRPDNQAAFFRDWANQRAQAAHVKGVYILINRSPSYLLIKPEDQVKQREFTETDSKELRDQMLPAMKQKQFDQALSSAVEFVSSRFAQRVQPRSASTATRTPPPPPGGGSYSQPSPPPSAPNVPVRGFGIGALLVVGLILFVGFKFLRSLFRGRATGYPQQGGHYGGGYGPGYGGGGFGRGFLGGILGGMAGGWLQNRASHRDSGNTFGAPPPSAGGSFGNSSDDVSFTGGGDAGGSFDSGSSGGGSSGDGSSGGSF
jgi:hypothetical protein